MDRVFDSHWGYMLMIAQLNNSHFLRALLDFSIYGSFVQFSLRQCAWLFNLQAICSILIETMCLAFLFTGHLFTSHWDSVIGFSIYGSFVQFSLRQCAWLFNLRVICSIHIETMWLSLQLTGHLFTSHQGYSLALQSYVICSIHIESTAWL